MDRYVASDLNKDHGNSALKIYEEYGFVIFDNLVPTDAFHTILSNINLLASSITPAHIKSSGENPFLWLVRNSRPDAGRLFDCLIKIPEVNQFLYSSVFQNIAKLLLKSDLVLSPPSQMNLRADHPEEQKFLYPWHTDYSYNCSSRNSLIFWIPMQDANIENGCLHIIPGSHKLTAEIEIDRSKVAAKNSAGYFHISNIQEILGAHSEIRAPLNVGSAVAFSSLLIHKSGVNSSAATRFSLQSRWFDGLSQDAVLGRWRGGVDEGRDPAEYLKGS